MSLLENNFFSRLLSSGNIDWGELFFFNSIIKIKLKLTHQNLADWTYINRPCVTKILGQLRQRQIVSIEQQQITLHNPNVLRQYFNIPSYLSISKQ